jgi:hypothetical protein
MIIIIRGAPGGSLTDKTGCYLNSWYVVDTLMKALNGKMTAHRIVLTSKYAAAMIAMPHSSALPSDVTSDVTSARWDTGVLRVEPSFQSRPA